MRSIGVVTSTRADYGLLQPLMRRITEDPDCDLRLYVTGTHLEEAFGATVSHIRADGFPIAAEIPLGLREDDPAGAAKAMAACTAGFGKRFAQETPDLLVLLGDRFELLAVAAAALPFNLPLAHLHGGEISEGAMDDGVRHALSKLSQLHFVSAEAHANRLRQMGEPAERITVCGAPGLDHLQHLELLDRATLETQFGLDLSEPPLLITFHPVTREPEGMEAHVHALLSALEASGKPLVFTQPNADPQGRLIAARIAEWAKGHPKRWMVRTFGTQAYFSLMSLAAAMVGNSSSGLIEAPSFHLPVVNVGSRQQGRTRGANVIDVEPTFDAISAGLRQALDPAFKSALLHAPNPYDAGGDAAGRILAVLKTVPLDGLCRKPFVDLQEGRP